MTEQPKTLTPKQQQAREEQLRGGLDGGEAARAMDVNLRDSGTAGISAPSGDVHPEAPSRAVPRTGLGARPVDAARLAGGKTPEMIRGYLKDLTFPARKEDLIRTARRNGAPDEVFGELEHLTATEYASFEEMLADYPRLPDEDKVEPRCTGRVGNAPPT